MPRLTGNRFIAEMLRDYGVTHVFQVPTAFFGVMREMEDMDIRRVVTHGEKAAAYMADGYARASKRVGICMAQNIGTANLGAGLADAYMGHSPVIAMTGALPAEHRYRHAYQEYDHEPWYESVTKSSVFIDKVSRLPDALRQAFRDATSGTPGPVHLDIPDDACSAEADLEVIVEELHTTFPAFRPEPEGDRVREAARAISQAQRPVIIAGGGVIASEAWAEVQQLAEMLTIPVATTLNGKLTMPASHPLNVGVPGRYSAWCANQTVANADLVIAIGTRLGGMTTWDWRIPSADMPTIQIDIDPSELGRNYPAQVALMGDARACVRRLIEVLEPIAPREDRLAEIRDRVGRWREEYAPMVNSDASPMRPERLCKEIAENLPDDAMVVSDTGHSGIWSGVLMPLENPGLNFIRCVGSLGWGLSASIGAKAAVPNRPVVCFTGDGGFWYHIAELETALRHGIAPVVVVNDNRSLNQEKGPIERAYGGQPYGRAFQDLMMFQDTNLAKVAEAIGCYAERVESPSEIGPAMQRAFASGRIAVLDMVSDIEAMGPVARMSDVRESVSG